MSRLPWAWSLAFVPAPATYVAFALSLGLDGRGGLLAAGAYFVVLVATAGWLVARVRRSGGAVGRLGMVPPRAKDVALGALGFLFVGGLWPVVDALVGRIGIPMWWTPPGGASIGPGRLVFLLGAGVLAATVGEEIWFRGYLLAACRERGWGFVPALLVNALAFGAMHLYGGPGFAIYITIWTVGPFTLGWRTGGLAAPMALHALNNTFAHILVPILWP